MAAEDVLKTIRSKKSYRRKMHGMDGTITEDEAAAQELKEEYEIRKRIQMGRIRDRLRRKMAKIKNTPSSALTLADSLNSVSPGTSRIDGTESSLTTRSRILSEASPSSFRLETRSPVETEEERRERIKKRWTIQKNQFPSIKSVLDQYRERLRAERESGLDLLETIRKLRGISKEKFYGESDMESEPESTPVVNDSPKEKAIDKRKEFKSKRKEKKNIDVFDDSTTMPVLSKLFSQKEKNNFDITDLESETDTLRCLFKSPEQTIIESKEATPEPEVNIQTPEPNVNISVTIESKVAGHTEKEEPLTEEKTKTLKGFSMNKYAVSSRINSRWPEGHKHFTKPVPESYVALQFRNKSHMSSSLRESMEAILAIYNNENKKYAEFERTTAVSNRNYTKSKFKEFFEDWRTELMKIAYDENFAAKHSLEKRFTYPVLPTITQENKPPLIESNSRLPKLPVISVSKHQAPLRKLKRSSHIIKSYNRLKAHKSKNNDKSKNIDETQEKLSCQIKSRTSYLPGNSSFLDCKKSEHSKNKFGNDTDENRDYYFLSSAERVSPSTDSAINEPNSDFENDSDINTHVKLPPISLQVRSSHTFRVSGNKSLQGPESDSIHRNTYRRKSTARSKSLLRIQHLLNKEPERNERIMKLFTELQNNRPNSFQRKSKKVKRRQRSIKGKDIHDNSGKISDCNKKDNNSSVTHDKKNQGSKSMTNHRNEREYTEFFKIEDRNGELFIESETRDPETLISLGENKHDGPCERMGDIENRQAFI